MEDIHKKTTRSLKMTRFPSTIIYQSKTSKALQNLLTLGDIYK